jgi:hypothetical protein
MPRSMILKAVLLVLALSPGIAVANCDTCNAACVGDFFNVPVCGVGLGTCAACSSWCDVGLFGNTCYCETYPCGSGGGPGGPFYPTALLRNGTARGEACRVAAAPARGHRAISVEVYSARS